MDGIPVKRLSSWQQVQQTTEPYGTATADLDPAAVSFRANQELNRKLFLYEGSAWKLQADALVINANEALQDRTGINKDVFELGGQEVEVDCRNQRCRTGSSMVTRAGFLPCRRIIHTVTPRYSDRYKVAAENALHQCFRSCLCKAMELRLRTIAFSRVYPARKKFPTVEAAHTALRTVRRFLEQHPDAFEQIIFCFETEEEMADFAGVAALYWPRGADEQRRSAAILQRMDLGDEWGERVIEERRIRITNVCNQPSNPNMRSRSKDGLCHGEVDLNLYLGDHWNGKMLIEPPPGHGFLEMVEDQDEERRAMVRQQLSFMSPQARDEYRYRIFLRQSRREDLRDLEDLRLFYVAGLDAYGRKVVAVNARNFHNEDEEVDLGMATLGAIRLLESVHTQPWILLYLHADLSAADRPPNPWIREILSLVCKRYSTYLRCIYVLEAPLRVRVQLWTLSFAVHRASYSRVTYVESMQQLDKALGARPEHILDVPNDVWDRMRARDRLRAGNEDRWSSLSRVSSSDGSEAEEIRDRLLSVSSDTGSNLDVKWRGLNGRHNQRRLGGGRKRADDVAKSNTPRIITPPTDVDELLDADAELL